MDPSTRLDHAVFQLTPTRTRCDLLVSSGKGVNEKIASGLLEPFLSHLRSAREQIPKGGYSFTLRPPPHAARGSPSSGGARGDDAAAASAPTTTTTADWFTKGTLDRFVRFVKTPDILERVAAIEKEIAHIESCFHQPEDDPATTTTTIHAAGAGGTAKAENQGSASSHGRGDDDNSNRKLLSPSSKPRADASNNGHDAAATHAENASKLCLQQTLETRKAVLLKEQGMAYARATVAGYDMPNVDDLVSFADAFGASRLREACINFKDICEKKEKDKIWMDELAAIEAFHRQTNHDLVQLEAVTAGHHLESNGAFSDTVTTDPITAAASSVDAGQDSNGNTPNREPWTSANNGIYHDKYQIPVGWPAGRHPPYMYNFQNPAQQMPPYQGYVFPATFPTCPPPGQFDNIVQQPPPVPPPFKQVSDGKPGKKKAAARRRSTTSTTTSGSGNVGERSHDSSSSRSESDGQTVHGVDASDQEEDDLGKGQHHKRSNKKSSRTVVIRNLNYISSERRRDEEDGSTSSSVSSVEGDIVENIVDSLKNYHRTSRHQHKKKGKSKSRRHNVEEDDDNCFGQINDADIGANAEVISSAVKGDESWNAFQSILMRDDESSPTDHQLNGKNNTRVQSDHGNELQEQFNAYSRDGDGGDQIKNNAAELATSSSAQHFPVVETQTLKGCRHRSLDATDPIAANDRDGDDDEKYNSESNPSRILDCDENGGTISMKRRSDYVDEECMFSGKKTDSEINVIISDDHVTACASETLTAPNYLQRDADFFFTVSNKSDSLQGGEHGYTAAECSMFEGDRHHHLRKYCSDGVVINNNIQKTTIRNNEINPAGDDSFIIVAATRPGGVDDHEHPTSHWDTDDVGIIQGLELISTHDEVGGAGVGAGHNHSTGNISGRMLDNYHEPDDLQMVLLQRSTAGSEAAASWAPEIDYTFHVAGESDSISIHEANGFSTETPDLIDNHNNRKGAPGEGSPGRKKPPAKDPKSKSMVNGSLTDVKPPPVVPSRNRKPSAMSREEIQRNKMLKEEENRKRIEALSVQRQKRIAERSSGGSSTTSPAMARVIGAATESKLGTASSKQANRAPRPAGSRK